VRLPSHDIPSFPEEEKKRIQTLIPNTSSFGISFTEESRRTNRKIRIKRDPTHHGCKRAEEKKEEVKKPHPSLKDFYPPPRPPHQVSFACHVLRRSRIL
jgi:hypothetical protein